MPHCTIPTIPLSERRAFTIGEIAALTRLSIASVYKQINTGHLVSIKLAGRRLVRAEDLDAFLCARGPLPAIGTKSENRGRRRVVSAGDEAA
jgi:excisionase family DNA binding protein